LKYTAVILFVLLFLSGCHQPPMVLSESSLISKEKVDSLSVVLFNHDEYMEGSAIKALKTNNIEHTIFKPNCIKCDKKNKIFSDIRPYALLVSQVGTQTKQSKPYRAIWLFELQQKIDNEYRSVYKFKVNSRYCSNEMFEFVSQEECGEELMQFAIKNLRDHDLLK
jgi:hypothetical protein